MLRDEIAYEIYKQGRATKATMPFEEFTAIKGSAFITELKELADSILSLPEMVEMREKTKRYDELFLQWWKKDEWDSPEDMLKEWKEKAERYDQLPIDDEGSMYSQKNLDRLQEWKEKAEKYDTARLQATTFTKASVKLGARVVDLEAQLDLIMHGLMVREECHNKFKTRTTANLLEPCEICGDKGTIEREATVSEVREFIEFSIGKYREAFFLVGGKLLFMKEKDVK